ncbi:hypothetical protein FHR70_001353 [Microvirga lupini]|uniref:Uncharacterized protein n=1 Tax=Microvirga lupini TaxID=420324 RepID=A0A7W4VJG9_9HYPH|nr:hypothetical protein [Microvirga lupini]
MPGLVPGIHVFIALWLNDVDGRNKCGHDEEGVIPGERQRGKGIHSHALSHGFPSATLRLGMTPAH